MGKERGRERGRGEGEGKMRKHPTPFMHTEHIEGGGAGQSIVSAKFSLSHTQSAKKPNHSLTSSRE